MLQKRHGRVNIRIWYIARARSCAVHLGHWRDLGQCRRGRGPHCGCGPRFRGGLLVGGAVGCAGPGGRRRAGGRHGRRGPRCGCGPRFRGGLLVGGVLVALGVRGGAVGLRLRRGRDRGAGCRRCERRGRLVCEGDVGRVRPDVHGRVGQRRFRPDGLPLLLTDGGEVRHGGAVGSCWWG
jgi:hypothetical protein